MPSADRPSTTVNSYASVHDTLSAKSKSYATKFKQFVLDYAVEWDKVVRTRVESGLKKAEQLRRDLDHYQKKVEAMRLSTNQIMAKGKTVPPTTAERLGRNEEKLISSKQTYNKIATDLCILMEEVTERAWRDLHPLLIKCAQFDMTMSGDESTILSSLNQSVSELKRVASDNGLSPQARLKDLASLNPELLSTRPGGVTGLTITSGGEPLGGSSPYRTTSGSNMAQPPGSVGPQGLGGFPVQVSERSAEPPPAYALSRNSSFNSYASAPAAPLSTMGMLSISQQSAPAPTFDDIYSANRSTAMTVNSAPHSGGLPPQSPARSTSFNSDYGSYSGAPVAAAPAAPPPPPPARSDSMPNYGAPSYGAPQSYGAPNSYGAPQSYGAPNSYGAPPMADARSLGPAPGRYAPDPPPSSYGQQSWAPPSNDPPQSNYSGSQSNYSAPFDEPANTNPFGN
jgi:hypothetical protein